MSDKRIGIFDSGVGGLDILSSLHHKFPHEDFLYLADSANLPYGDKKPEELLEICLEAIHFLLSQDLKSIIIACHTASIALLPFTKGFSVPLTTLVTPLLKTLLPFANKSILFLSTKSTLASGLYQKKIQKNFPNMKASFQACPHFVSHLESPFPLSEQRLSLSSDHHIDALVLACTHYPLLKTKLQALFPHAEIIDAKKEITLPQKTTRKAHGGHCRYLVTGDPFLFQTKAETLFGKSIPPIQRIEKAPGFYKKAKEKPFFQNSKFLLQA